MLTDKNTDELHRKGYSVVENVLTSQECDSAMNDLQSWLTHFGNGFPITHHSVIWDYNVAHLDVTWRLRLKTKPVFSDLWGTEKLLTSFDSIAIGRPPAYGEELFDDESKHWLHADSTPSRVGLHAYQGALYLEEQTSDDWVFQVFEKSHMMLDNFFIRFPKKADKARRIGFYYDLSDEDIQYFQDFGCQLVRVPVPKGGLALWDSRLVHANARPIRNRKNADRWRFVSFISMTPAIWANETDIEKHREAYMRPTTTNHWSSQGIKFNTEGVDVHPIPFVSTTTLPEIARTDEAMKLSAMIPYDFNDGKPNGDEFWPIWKRSSDVNLPAADDKEKEYANGHI